VLGHAASLLHIQESQPYPGLLQVSGDKPLGKPAIHLSQELPGWGTGTSFPTTTAVCKELLFCGG
jgi:hypothetical protein